MEKRDLIKGIKDWVTGSWQFPVLAVLLMALALYVFTIAGHISQLPYEGFSREVPVAEVAYGFSKHNDNHMTAAVNGDTIGVFTIDGHGGLLKMMDPDGSVKATYDLEIDLFDVRAVEGHFPDDDTYKVFYQDEGLYELTVDLTSGQWSAKTLEKEISNFSYDAQALVYTTKDGLFVGTATDEAFLAKPVSEAEIRAFDVTSKGDGLLLTVLEKVNADFVNCVLYELNADKEVINEYLVRAEDNNRNLLKVQDTVYKDNQLSIVYMYNDRKYSTNILTVHQYAFGADGSLSSMASANTYEERYGLSYTPVSILEVNEDGIVLLRDDTTEHGLNIAKSQLTKGTNSLQPMTKTSKTSTSPQYFVIDGEEVLVFADLTNDSKRVLMASGDQDLIDYTSSVFSVDLWSLTGSAVIVFMGSLFSVLIFALQIVPIPAAILVVMLMSTREYPLKDSLYLAVPLVAHMIMKFIITIKGITGAPVFMAYQPAYFGQSISIYTTLIFTAMAAYWVSYRISKTMDTPGPAYRYTMFALIDMSLYAFTVISYAFTVNLLGKI